MSTIQKVHVQLRLDPQTYQCEIIVGYQSDPENKNHRKEHEKLAETIQKMFEVSLSDSTSCKKPNAVTLTKEELLMDENENTMEIQTNIQ